MRGLGGRRKGGPTCCEMPTRRGRCSAGRVEGRMLKRAIRSRPIAPSLDGVRLLPPQVGYGGP